ncbi:MAG: hypothetical protein ACLSVD_13875 [Eggerthellaceae bacterium]
MLDMASAYAVIARRVRIDPRRLTITNSKGEVIVDNTTRRSLSNASAVISPEVAQRHRE